MKKVFFIFLGLLTALFASLAAMRSPSRYRNMTQADIKAELLGRIPLGSSSARVRSFLKRKTGKDPHYARAFSTVEGKAVIRDGKILNLRYYAGAVHARLANYDPPGAWFSLVSTNVNTLWEFDKNDRLIDLRVTK